MQAVRHGGPRRRLPMIGAAAGCALSLAALTLAAVQVYRALSDLIELVVAVLVFGATR